MKKHIQSIFANKINASITISGSKSESNRLLILQQLFPNLQIKNLSDSDDTVHLQKALSENQELVNIGHAGTAMRFLTAYFAIKKNSNVVLTGSERMQNRPVQILVDALKKLGAKIDYEAKIGYPPLRIKGSGISSDKVKINGNISSQYISALLLIAPSLPTGLTIELTSKITSIPYIKMTLSLLNQLGIETSFKENIICVKATKKIPDAAIVVESDWSSASYFYSVIALSEIGSEITLTSYKKNSLQGDVRLANIYSDFGVTTDFLDAAICIKKTAKHTSKLIKHNLKNAPDIAQTIAVTCFGLGIACELSGLHTLKIKETDRLVALQNELTKLGAKISVTAESLSLKRSDKIKENCEIKTYNDHRMAMAFAPLAIKIPVTILDAQVVTKSYKNFWKDWQQIGFQIDKN